MIGMLHVAFDLYGVLGDNIMVVDRLISPSTVDIKGGFEKRLSGGIHLCVPYGLYFTTQNMKKRRSCTVRFGAKGHPSPPKKNK